MLTGVTRHGLGITDTDIDVQWGLVRQGSEDSGGSSGGEGGIRTREKQGPYAISSRARSSTPAPLRCGWSAGELVTVPAWWTLARETIVR